jgi:outer membrane protein
MEFKLNILRQIRLIVPVMLAQVAASLQGQSVVDDYVRYGLENNVVVQQKNISLQQSVNALEDAKSYFLPSVSFNGSYTTGQGGRALEFPVGDLLNPVYSTLNALTQTNAFPQIENTEVNFFPTNYYDVKIHTVMPLLNTDIIQNTNIRSEQVQMQETELLIYKRELAHQIQTAYYNYLSAATAVTVYEEALVLVTENLNVNTILLKEGKGLPAQVNRAESEVSSVTSQLNDAKNQMLNAGYYLNFLLNKPLTENILMDTITEMDIQSVINNNSNLNVLNREELQLISSGERIQQSLLKMEQQYWVPQVNAFLDLGAQAEDLVVDADSRYFLVGVQIDVPIYQGGRNTNAKSNASLDLQNTALTYNNTLQQLQMSGQIAQNNVSTAITNYEAAKKQLAAAEAYFNLMSKAYLEGTVNQVELLDARTQFTTAKLNINLNLYRVLTANAELQRANATYPLPQ